MTIFFLGFLSLELILLGSGMVGNMALKTRNPSTSAFIRDFELQNQKKVRVEWLPLDRISTNLIRAILVAEDDSFFQHDGVDLRQFKASLKTNIKKGRLARGGSTITMQLVKNLYLSGTKSPLRKINEILLAMDMENRVPKFRILEVYLNMAEWGFGIYGAGAASRFYFKKPASDLSAAEAAYLAALLPNPVFLSSKGSGRAKKRQRVILQRMSRRSLPGTLDE